MNRKISASLQSLIVMTKGKAVIDCIIINQSAIVENLGGMLKNS